MHVGARVRVAVVVSATFLTFAACGGAARRPAAATGGASAEVVRRLQVPDSPYRIIYYAPVNLAKPPDTTAHAPPARKGRR